jgi:hypothetical protein
LAVRHFKKLTLPQEEFIIEHLRREWREAERAAKRHEVVKHAKSAGVVLGKVLLTSLLLAGVLTVVAVAPNAFAAFGRGGTFRKHMSGDKLPSQLRAGSARGYWRYERVAPGHYSVSLTSRGKKVALRAALRDFKLHRQKKWDGMWRVVVFDIARKRNPERSAFRHKLEEMGMCRLQDSVFVYPYPCAEEVMFFASILDITQSVHVLEARFLTSLDPATRQLFQI